MADPHEYSMSGIKVKFPHQAYPSQVSCNQKWKTSFEHRCPRWR